MKTFLVTIAIIASFAAFGAAIAVPIIVFKNDFTIEERVRAGNIQCQPHNGVERFDKYPGARTDFVICRDGYSTAVLQRVVDP